MKLFFYITIFSLNINLAFCENNLFFYLDSAYKNNLKLNAERKNLEATKQNINISRSEFLPNISISGSLEDNQSTNRTNQSGSNLPDTNKETQTKSLSIDQKVFQGFEGYNSILKSKLEVQQANLKLKETEQSILFQTANVYFNLSHKIKNKNFNLINISLFERQVETDAVRMQKGEITLTDLAQSESSLAGAKAKLISAENELTNVRSNFERIIRTGAPKNIEKNFNLNKSLPSSLSEALLLAEKSNPRLLIAKLNYEIAKKNLNIEKAQVAPSASINYSRSESDDFSSAVDKVDQESLKATIKWPITKGGKNYSSIKKTKLKTAQSNLILQDVINEIKTDTTNAWSVFQSSQSVLEATLSQVNAAEIANEGITLEYDSGNTRTTLEVIQSRSLLLDARIANSKAERDFIVSKFKILQIIGDLTIQTLKSAI